MDLLLEVYPDLSITPADLLNLPCEGLLILLKKFHIQSINQTMSIDQLCSLYESLYVLKRDGNPQFDSYLKILVDSFIRANKLYSIEDLNKLFDDENLIHLKKYTQLVDLLTSTVLQYEKESR